MLRRLLVAASLVAATVSSLPAPASGATTTEPLGGTHCWGRCQTCTSRCSGLHDGDRYHCERACLLANERCCETAGLGGQAKTCGCD